MFVFPQIRRVYMAITVVQSNWVNALLARIQHTYIYIYTHVQAKSRINRRVVYSRDGTVVKGRLRSDAVASPPLFFTIRRVNAVYLSRAWVNCVYIYSPISFFTASEAIVVGSRNFTSLFQV